MRTSNKPSDEARDKRAALWELREAAAEFSNARWLQECGKKPFGDYVGLRGSRGETAGWANLSTCGSWSSCPTCSRRVAARRSAELTELLEWANREGHTVVMLTLTAQHHSRMVLKEFWDGLTKAWAGVGRMWGSETEKSYAARVAANAESWRRYQAQELKRRPKDPEDIKPRRIGVKERAGVIGYVKATEATVTIRDGKTDGKTDSPGRPDFHVHFHVLTVIHRDVMPTDPEDQLAHVARFRKDMFALWLAALKRENLSAIETVKDPKTGDISYVGADARIMYGSEAVARYLSKMCDAEAAQRARSAARDLAVEAAAGQFKEGRRDSRSPFEVLADLQNDPTNAADAWAWRAWVSASRGRRQLVWSDGLRKMAGLNAEATDEEIAAEDTGTVNRLAFDRVTWYRAMRSLPMRLAVLELLESDGLAAVRSFLDDHLIRYWLCDDTGNPIPNEVGLLPGDEELFNPILEATRGTSRELCHTVGVS